MEQLLVTFPLPHEEVEMDFLFAVEVGYGVVVAGLISTKPRGCMP